MKALGNALAHPALLLAATAVVIAVWAGAGSAEESRRSKDLHPASCNGCRVASGQAQFASH